LCQPLIELDDVWNLGGAIKCVVWPADSLESASLRIRRKAGNGHIEWINFLQLKWQLCREFTSEIPSR